jgi:hypothetical protein
MANFTHITNPKPQFESNEPKEQQVPKLTEKTISNLRSIIRSAAKIRQDVEKQNATLLYK